MKLWISKEPNKGIRKEVEIITEKPNFIILCVRNFQPFTYLPFTAYFDAKLQEFHLRIINRKERGTPSHCSLRICEKQFQEFVLKTLVFFCCWKWNSYLTSLTQFLMVGKLNK